MSSTELSVIIPVYNAARFLQQCLESVLAATGSRMEVICLDDGSTDESPGILDRFAARDARVKVVHKANEGYGATMNRGLGLACGEYIGIVEPDDFIEGPMFKDLFALAQCENCPDVVKSAYVMIYDDDPEKPEVRRRCSFWGRVPEGRLLRAVQAPELLRYHPSIWSGIYRRDFLEQNKIRFKEVPGAGWVDNPFMMNTLCAAQGIVYTNREYYCYRDAHEGSSSANIGNFRMPLERWLDMDEVVHALGITDEEVLEVHAYRCMRYLDIACQVPNCDKVEWARIGKKMTQKIDPCVIANNCYVSKSYRTMYETLSGQKLPNSNNAPYCVWLLKEAYWKTRQNGIAYMFKRAFD